MAILSIKPKGLSADASPGGFPGFGRRTSFCHFQGIGTRPVSKQFWNTDKNASGYALIAALVATMGIPSGPGAFPNLTRSAAFFSSSADIDTGSTTGVCGSNWMAMIDALLYELDVMLCCERLVTLKLRLGFILCIPVFCAIIRPSRSFQGM